MTRESAIQRGFQYVGCYSRSKDEIKQTAEEIRKQGYKLLIVTEPDDPLSRGTIGKGYTIYAEPRYNRDERAKKILNGLPSYDSQIIQLRTKCQEEINSIEARREKDLEWLKVNGYQSESTPIKID